MFWQYLLVFLGALLFDLAPFPFPPAFTIMSFLQIIYDLNVWVVIIIGVLGSVLGRYILLLYAPLLSKRFLKDDKNKDIEFLGQQMNKNIWKGQMVILAYSLLPLPTTPLFLGAGISKIKARYIIPWFLIGKFTSDSVMLHMGKYAAENTQRILDDLISWKSFISLMIGLMMLFALFFINWRALIQTKKLELNFKILNKNN
jgi:membrane protein DedA with SNARE-associated domain